jgi:hypothetical protein
MYARIEFQGAMKNVFWKNMIIWRRNDKVYMKIRIQVWWFSVLLICIDLYIWRSACCSALQCVAVCCSVLQCVLTMVCAGLSAPISGTIHLSVLQCLDLRYHISECLAMSGSVSILSTIRLNVLQCCAVPCGVLQCVNPVHYRFKYLAVCFAVFWSQVPDL